MPKPRWHPTCTWVVERIPSTRPYDPENDDDPPEPQLVECGARLRLTHGGRGWQCEAGHEHLPIEIDLAPFGPAWEREQEARRGGDLP